jgi:signal transduction histidine kinase
MPCDPQVDTVWTDALAEPARQQALQQRVMSLTPEGTTPTASDADLGTELVRRTQERDAAERELDDLIYSVSHDLRAPLRAIQGFSQVLQAGAGSLDEEDRDYLRRIAAASERLGELVGAVLQLSLITRAQLHRETVDLSTLAMRICDDLRAREPSREVEVDIAAGVTATGDPVLVRTLLEHLLGNAWKFSRDRRPAHVGFSARPDPVGTTFEVTDDGVGFDLRPGARLFGAFQRLHGAGEFEGLGIGLATARRIVHRHGGTIDATGERDRGARVRFTLPPAGEGPVGQAAEPVAVGTEHPRGA